MLISRKLKILLLIMLCLIAVESQGTTITLNDGQHHIVDYNYNTGGFWVDRGDGEILGTTLEIVQGGKCGVAVGNMGKVILAEGVLTGIYAEHNSFVTFLSGTLDDGYFGVGNSHLEMSGGIITGDSYSRGIWLRNYSTATISGGMLSGDFMLRDSSALTLVGSDFAINGVSVSLYEDIKDYATYEHISDGIYGYTGTITGTLADGSSLNNYFEIWDNGGVSNGNIYLIPEPCSVLLLGFGVLILRKRKMCGNR